MWWLESNNLIYSVMNVAVSFLTMYRQWKIFAQTVRIGCMGYNNCEHQFKEGRCQNAVVMGKLLSR